VPRNRTDKQKRLAEYRSMQDKGAEEAEQMRYIEEQKRIRKKRSAEKMRAKQKRAENLEKYLLLFPLGERESEREVVMRSPGKHQTQTSFQKEKLEELSEY
jgi:hypothetical protein